MKPFASVTIRWMDIVAPNSDADMFLQNTTINTAQPVMVEQSGVNILFQLEKFAFRCKCISSLLTNLRKWEQYDSSIKSNPVTGMGQVDSTNSENQLWN